VTAGEDVRLEAITRPDHRRVRARPSNVRRQGCRTGVVARVAQDNREKPRKDEPEPHGEGVGSRPYVNGAVVDAGGGWLSWIV
jgi:hypothetical protein